MITKKNATAGACYRCGKDLTSQHGAGTHLKSCLDQWHRESILYEDDPDSDQVTRVYWHVSVTSDRRHWMELLVPQETTLEQLDRFLRGTWLECCGHLSAFVFGDLWVSSTLDEEDCNTINDIDISGIISMESPVARVLLPGFKVKHQYDMGSPTELTLSCRNIYALRDRPEILAIARNSPSDEEHANSPREGYDCFDDRWLNEPPAVALDRRSCTCVCAHSLTAA